MVGVEYILLMSTSVYSIVLLVLLFLSGKKDHKPKGKEYLSRDLIKIKEQISEE